MMVHIIDSKKSCQGILSAIGRTPLIQLTQLYPESTCSLFAKLELVNPGGSIKDRPALAILMRAVEEGNITHNTTIVESSSGNMAIGLAQVCCYLGLKLMVVVDPTLNAQTARILQTYGAHIESVTEPDLNGSYLGARLNRVRILLESIPDSYWPNQYTNKDNVRSHYQTMHEIVTALDREPDYLFVATSTCGTIMGCAEYIHQFRLKTKIIAVDAVGSVLFGKPLATRHIPGHGAGVPSTLLDTSYVDQVVHITDQECVLGCRQLLQREAILAGGSSGAVVVALGKILPHIHSDATCAVIFCDRGERYLDTIYCDEWVATNLGTIDEEQIINSCLFQVGNTSFSGVNGL